MPSKRELTKMIPQLYKCNAESLGLFFFVKAQLQVFPTLSISKAIANYRKFADITYDDWDDESMRTTYNRVEKYFYETSRTDQQDCKEQG